MVVMFWNGSNPLEWLRRLLAGCEIVRHQYLYASVAGSNPVRWSTKTHYGGNLLQHTTPPACH